MGDKDTRAMHLLEKILRDPRAEPVDLPLSLLHQITNDFSDSLLIGKGGFGVVYKGVLSNGMEVAVKKIKIIGAVGKHQPFYGEATCLIRTDHRNIVRLLGFCADTQSKAVKYEGKNILADKVSWLLCFEYVPGSLHSSIEDGLSGVAWHQRYKIFMGICQGLRYLHEKQRIVHMDLKPENILLDQNMVPKITDFGLSRLFSNEQTRTVTSHNPGTIGYMAPEYLFRGQITFKNDIYSLGVVLLQIITGTKSIPDRALPNIQNELETWRNKLEKSQFKQVEVCAEIARQCTEENPEDRPSSVNGIIERLGKTESIDQCTETGLSGSVVLQREKASMELRGEASSEIIPMSEYPRIFSMDVHPIKQWIITSHYKSHFCIWNYQRKDMVRGVTRQRKDTSCAASTAKFIQREQWIMAGDYDGHIHVYKDDDTMKQVKTWRPHTEAITSLAIHPNKTYVLSASYNYAIKLWDWTAVQFIEPDQKFKGHNGSVYQIAFNPIDANTFASASEDTTIKIWSLDSSRPTQTLTGHSLQVRCLDYFSQGDRQFLITGSDDTTAKIWDLQTNKCVQTLEGHTGRVSTVCSHPMLQKLMTGSFDGTVRLWNSTTFRLEGRLNFGLEVHAFGCSVKDFRVMIGHRGGLVILEVDKEGHFVSTGSRENVK